MLEINAGDYPNLQAAIDYVTARGGGIVNTPSSELGLLAVLATPTQPDDEAARGNCLLRIHDPISVATAAPTAGASATHPGTNVPWTQQQQG